VFSLSRSTSSANSSTALGSDLLRFVDQLFAGLGVALYNSVQTFFGNVVRVLSCSMGSSPE
jgi:hypothetical protein